MSERENTTIARGKVSYISGEGQKKNPENGLSGLDIVRTVCYRHGVNRYGCRVILPVYKRKAELWDGLPPVASAQSQSASPVDSRWVRYGRS